jgi:hypothetical protein
LNWLFELFERVLAFLQWAQDKLMHAVGLLRGERWQQVDRLLADIGVAISRGSVQLGPTASPSGESPGRPAFWHSRLSALAKQGQALANHTAAFQSPSATDDIT